MKVIKIGAIWCPGCLVMKPLWSELEKENPDLLTVYLDFDKDKEKISKYDIGSDIPVFIFLDKEGNELERLVGEFSKKEILAKIEKYKDA